MPISEHFVVWPSLRASARFRTTCPWTPPEGPKELTPKSFFALLKNTKFTPKSFFRAALPIGLLDLAHGPRAGHENRIEGAQ